MHTGVDPGLLRRCLEGRSFSQRGAQQLSVNHELRGAATVLGMAPDAKVIVLRGDRVTVETIVSFVAGHAEGIGAADPVRRLCVWHDHTFTEHQAGKIRNKLLREWEWAEVPPGEISPTFRELYKEHVGDRYGDADGSSRGRTVGTVLFGDPNALV